MSRARAERWIADAVPRTLALLGCASLLCATVAGCASSDKRLRYPVGISGGPVEEASTRPAPASSPARNDGHEQQDQTAADDSEHQPVRGFEIPFRSVRRGGGGVSATPSDADPSGSSGDDGSDGVMGSDSVPAVSGSSDDD